MNLKLAFRNIKNAILEFPKEYILMMVSQMLAVISIFFAYGIFSSYSAKMQELDIECYSFGAYLEDGTVEQFREILPDMLGSMQKRLDYVFIGSFQDDIPISMHFEYYNGEYRWSDTINKNAPMDKGRNISDKDILKGDNVVCVSGNIEGNIGDTVDIGNVEYQIIGRQNINAKNLEIPFTSQCSELGVNIVYLNFEQLPKQSDYIMFKETLEGMFGDKVSVESFELKDSDELISMRSIIVISVGIGFISALNTCLIYGYIISRRGKQMAVYGIVGATSRKRLAINELEIMLVSIAIAFIGFFVYRFGMENIIVNIYESSIPLYGFKSYSIMILLYIMSMFINTYIMLIFTNSRKLTNMLRQAKR